MSRRGFTLVEVLVALVVLSTALLVLAQGFSTGGRASVLAQKETVAALLAREKLAEIEAGVVSSTAASEGEFGEEYADFSYEVLPATHASGLTEVTVRVRWKFREQDRTVEAVRLIGPR